MTETTREERPTCSCGRPAVHDPWEDEARYCAEHQRVVVADEIYGDWLEAHEAMREKFGEVLASGYGSALQDVVDTANGEYKASVCPLERRARNSRVDGRA